MQFQVISGNDLGQVFSGDVSAATIGRGSGNLVALSDSKVSRQHARIEVVAGSAVVEDLGSTNGTYVNEQRLASRGRRNLQPGDQVRVGDTTLRFEGLVGCCGSSRRLLGRRGCQPGPIPAALARPGHRGAGAGSAGRRLGLAVDARHGWGGLRS